MTTANTLLEALDVEQARMKEWFEHMHRTPEGKAGNVIAQSAA